MKMPRSFKKLSLLLAFTILVTCVVTFKQYQSTQNYPSAGVEEWEIRIRNHKQRLGGIKSHTTTPKRLQESKSAKLLHQRAPPAEVHRDDLQNLDSPIAQDLLSRLKLNCLDHICSEFVTKADRPHFDYCIRKTWKRRSRYKEPSDSICRFVNGTGRSPIALASFPGSGNTWVRGLIQAATGLCTGAIYCDRTLRKTGFPGESLRSGIVLAVKTHHDDPRWAGVHYDMSAPFTYFKKVEHIPLYSSGIFILRNPFDSLVAEYSRKLREEDLDSHVNLPQREYFGSNITWNTFVLEQTPIWERTVLAWVLNNHKHPVLVVKYENLKNNTEKEIEKMLDFLQAPYSRSRLREVVTRGYEAYKRPHRDEFDHYTAEQRATVRAAIVRVANSLKEHKVLDKANVSLYL